MPSAEILSTRDGCVTIDRRSDRSRPKLQGDDRRAQATMMMVRRLLGDASAAQLAEDFHLSRTTVNTRLAAARADGVPETARKVFIEEMLPQSMAVVQEALRSDDLKLALSAALKIIDGLRVLEAPASQSTTVVEESFEVWRRRVAAGGADPTAGDIIDVTVTPGAEAADAAASPAGAEALADGRPAGSPSSAAPAQDAPGAGTDADENGLVTQS